MWNIKIIQIDNRESNVYTQSKDLTLGRQHMNTYSDSWHDADRSAMKQEELSNPWKFWDFSRVINAIQAKRMNSMHNHDLNISYKWIQSNQNELDGYDLHYTWIKIKKIRELLVKETDSNTLIIFLDSDAFIRDRNELIKLIDEFIKNENNDFYISCDVPRPRNTKCNSGFMMIKSTSVMIDFFENIWNGVALFPKAKHEFPHEQILINHYFNDKCQYASRTTEVNTPIGEIVRHVWYKEMIPELMIDQAFCLLAEEID